MKSLGSCTVLISAKNNQQPPLIAHSFDTPGGIDFTLKPIPRNPILSPRPIYSWNESAIPRYSNNIIGHITIPTQRKTTLSYIEAAAGIANESGVFIAESTCSAIFRADPIGHGHKNGGKALLCYQELTRIALEYCTTARQAIVLMGQLAEEYGFYGNVDSELTGSGETLAVVDTKEAYVMHILPDDSGSSAVWIAQRVSNGEAACIANMFIIRNVDFNDMNTVDSTFLMSATALDIAVKLHLYNPSNGDAFDFARIFSAGEARHQYYSGRRQWRALSLMAPSLQLNPWYTDLLIEDGYPFSVVPDITLQRNDLMQIMRDTYQGTEFDLSRQPASGPFGCTDRYDGANGCAAIGAEEDGCFERPIAIYRMAYSFVGEPNGIQLEKRTSDTNETDGETKSKTSSTSSSTNGKKNYDFHHVLHFAPHVSQTSVYLPVLIPSTSSSVIAVPLSLSSGTVAAIDRTTGYWTFRIVKQTMKGLVWNKILEFVKKKQIVSEKKISELISGGCGSGVVTSSSSGGGNSVENMQIVFGAVVKDVIADWWEMNDDMLLRFGDGWEHEWSSMNDTSTSSNSSIKKKTETTTDTMTTDLVAVTNLGLPVAYPIDWLKRHNFFRTATSGAATNCDVHFSVESFPPPPPSTKLWTVNEKLKLISSSPPSAETDPETSSKNKLKKTMSLSSEGDLDIDDDEKKTGNTTLKEEDPWLKSIQTQINESITTPWDYSTLLEGPDLSPNASSNSNEIITNHLYLGSQEAARSAVTDGIKSVCCCLNNIKENVQGEYQTNGIEYMIMINFHDGALGTIDPFAEQGADWIATQLRNNKGPVLIHCSVGKTRATTVCVVFLMKYCNMHLKQAMQFVREKRHRAYPILHFWELLIVKECALKGTKSSSLVLSEVQKYHTETINANNYEEGGLEYQILQLVGMGFLEADAFNSLTRQEGDMNAAIAELLKN